MRARGRARRNAGIPPALVAAGLVAAGGLGAVAVGSEALRPPPLSAGRLATGRPPLAEGVRVCAEGPATTADFEITDGGFPRFTYQGDDPGYKEFFFVRAMYSDGGRGGFGFRGRGGRGGYLGDRGPAWSIDYASADRHMMQVARRLSNIDACTWEHPVSLADPELRRFPFLYSLEWGNADLTDEEVLGLRGYLEAGGFMMIDDFWGSLEWMIFTDQMRRVLPGRPIVDVPRDDLLFHSHFSIEGDIVQVPNIGRGRDIAQGFVNAPTFEQDGYTPYVRGIFDDDGRLMVVINWNTDLGDALEWAEDPFYPLRFSTFASEMFLNMIMYSMSH